MLEEIARQEASDAFAPNNGQFGPAMSKLTAMQQRFVIASIAIGGRRGGPKAAAWAGYNQDNKPGSTYLRVMAYKLKQDPKIRAAFVEMAKNEFEASTLYAANFLINLVADSKAEHKDRIKAASAILDRGGLHAMSEHKVSVTHNDDRASKLLRLAELARKAGQDPRQVLGDLADVTDADFVMVEPKLVSSQ